MKKLLSLIAIAAFGLTTAFAQTPATAPAKAKTVVKKEVKTNNILRYGFIVYSADNRTSGY